MKLPISLRLILGSLLTTAACGGGGGGVALEDLPTELETALCESQVECGAYADLAACLEANDIGSGLANLQGAVDRGTVTYDADAAAACLDAFRGAFSCTYSGSSGNSVDDACADVFVGTVADGAVCVDDEECLSEECNIPSCPDGMCCMGTCVAAEPPPTIVPVGGDCSASNTECAEGSYCKTVDTMSTCTALAAENAACDDFSGCAVGLYCDLDFMTFMGTCKRPPGPGEACEIDGFALCDRRDNYCDPATMTCVARKAVGEACELESECVEYAYCMATCLASPGLGDACDVSGPRYCLGGLECTSGTCAAPPADPVCP